MDIVMRALPVAYDASFGPLRGEFDTLAGRLLDRVRQLSGGDATAPAEGQ
jgi:hypothetical protein